MYDENYDVDLIDDEEYLWGHATKIGIIVEGLLGLVVTTLMFFIAGGGVVYGWEVLSPVFDFFEFILFLPIVGWVIYFIIKFLLALCIGSLVFIFHLIKRIIIYFKDKKETT